MAGVRVAAGAEVGAGGCFITKKPSTATLSAPSTHYSSPINDGGCCRGRVPPASQQDNMSEQPAISSLRGHEGPD